MLKTLMQLTNPGQKQQETVFLIAICLQPRFVNIVIIMSDCRLFSVLGGLPVKVFIGLPSQVTASTLSCIDRLGKMLIKSFSQPGAIARSVAMSLGNQEAP